MRRWGSLPLSPTRGFDTVVLFVDGTPKIWPILHVAESCTQDALDVLNAYEKALDAVEDIVLELGHDNSPTAGWVERELKNVYREKRPPE